MASIRYLYILCMVSIGIAIALPASDKIENENDLMTNIYSECLKKESINCIKYKAFQYFDKMFDKGDISLTEGITVVKTSSNIEEGAPRSVDGSNIDTLLLDKLSTFLRTHSVKIDLKGSDIIGIFESAGRSLEDLNDNIIESRGKKKKAQKILGPLMMAVALKAAALLPLALGAIALIAGKALLIGKIALVISGIIGLKKLLGGQKHVTYEVVSHPHHSSSHVVSHDDGGHSGYSSAGDYSAGFSNGGSSSNHGWARSIAQNVQDSGFSEHKQTSA